MVEEIALMLPNLMQSLPHEEKQTLPFSIWACEEMLDAA